MSSTHVGTLYTIDIQPQGRCVSRLVVISCENFFINDEEFCRFEPWRAMLAWLLISQKTMNIMWIIRSLSSQASFLSAWSQLWRRLMASGFLSPQPSPDTVSYWSKKNYWLLAIYKMRVYKFSVIPVLNIMSRLENLIAFTTIFTFGPYTYIHNTV